MSTAAPLPDYFGMDEASLPTLEQLPEDQPTLRHMVLELMISKLQDRRELAEALHRIDLLLRRLYGPRSERFHPDQGQLFDEATDEQDHSTAAAAQVAGDTARPQRRKARPHGRRPLPADLPRRAVHHELTAAERLCSCGRVRVDIGTEPPREQLDWQPASFFVWQHFIHKYLCPHCAKRATALSDQAPAVAAPDATTPATVPAAAESPAITGSDQSPAIPAPQATTEATAPAAAESPAITGSAQSPAIPAPQATTEATVPATAEPPAITASERCPVALEATGAATVPSAAETTTTTAVSAAEATLAHETSSTASIASSAVVPGVPGPVIITASKPAMPIDKGLPGPGLLAQVIVSKYADHLPLYRQENITARQGVLLPRSTTCDWMAAAAELLGPLYALMVATVLRSRWLHTDDTRVKNLGHEPDTTALARFWVYLGDRDHPYNVFDFTVNRQRDGPQQFLKDYRGYLHADAFSGYDALYLPSAADGQAAIIECACNAHARRKFVEAQTSDVGRAYEALAYYRQLYLLEERVKVIGLDEAARLRMRQELAVTILEKFHSWLAQQQPLVLPKSPMAEAINYALNNWTALCCYTKQGFLEIDNNVAEREMKQIATGRKNWLFVGSAKGGRTAAVLFSFTFTCRRLGINPWAYLQDVLGRLPELPESQLSALLPDRWQAASRQARAASSSSTTLPVPESMAASQV
jgi:transposase